MTTVSYIVAVDWDDSGDFGGEDISADVLALHWRLGLAQPYDSLAAPSVARITVRNIGRSYSPESGTRDLSPGKAVRIQSNDGSTTRTHFTGFISRVEPLPGDRGARTAILHLVGPERQLERVQARLPPQVSVTADQVISALLDAIPLRRLRLKNVWLLDMPDHAELGSNTRLPDDYPRSLETGRLLFAYVADTWVDGISAAEAIRQVSASERGRFFVDRDGRLVFHNRHHTLLGTGVDATFTDSMDGLAYDYGADVLNRVSVSIIPRRIGATGTTVWTLENPLEILPGETGFRQIVVPYRDTDQRPLGALTVIQPVPGLDYQANTLPDGSGLDRTAQVVVLLAQAGMSSAALDIRNNSRERLYLLAGMQLRGTPLIQGDPLLVEQTAPASLNRYGSNSLRLDLPTLSSPDEADQISRFELARRQNPRGLARRLELSSPAHLPHILARTLFDRIRIVETQTAHSSDYFIVAEEHEVDLGGARHRVAWVLEPADAPFWILNTHQLDQTAILAY